MPWFLPGVGQFCFFLSRRNSVFLIDYTFFNKLTASDGRI